MARRVKIFHHSASSFLTDPGTESASESHGELRRVSSRNPWMDEAAPHQATRRLFVRTTPRSAMEAWTLPFHLSNPTGSDLVAP